jgi:hypothetical protein
MPLVCPSFQSKLMAYRPTEFTLLGRTGGLKIGNAVFDSGFCSPGARPSTSRFSTQVAHGHAARNHANVQWLVWPSFHRISTPVPSVWLTRTCWGSMASRENSCCGRDALRATSSETMRMPSWLIPLFYTRRIVNRVYRKSRLLRYSPGSRPAHGCREVCACVPRVQSDTRRHCLQSSSLRHSATELHRRR